MNILEKILVVVAILSLLLDYISIPGGFGIFFISMMILALLYWPFGLAFLNGIRFRHILKREAYEGIGIDKLIPAFLVGQGLALMCVAFVFWISRFLFGEIMLYAGFFMSIISLIVVLIIAVPLGFKGYRKMITRIAIFMSVGIILLITPFYYLEVRFDPFSLDPYEELVCENNPGNTSDITTLLLELNGMLDYETNIRGFDIDSNYLIIYCDNWHYRVSPEHAGLFFREQRGDQAAYLRFKKKPGEPRLEMYFGHNTDRIHWEDNTTHLLLPADRSDEFVDGMRRIFCHIRQKKIKDL